MREESNLNDKIYKMLFLSNELTSYFWKLYRPDLNNSKILIPADVQQTVIAQVRHLFPLESSQTPT